TDSPTELLDDHRALEPPDPIPNSEVKRRIADGSVGLPHVRVGHRQAHTPNPRSSKEGRGFVFVRKKNGPMFLPDKEADAGPWSRVCLNHGASPSPYSSFLRYVRHMPTATVPMGCRLRLGRLGVTCDDRARGQAEALDPVR